MREMALTFFAFSKGGFEYSRHLKTAQVKLISQSDCQHKYYSEDEVNRYMFCAAGRNWEDDACQVTLNLLLLFYFIKDYMNLI